MEINRPKTVHNVRGYQIGCINFQKCPLCFGCRRFNTADPECKICLENKKQNICKVDLHRDEITSRMITKGNLHLPEKLEFI